ncbi:MAG: hypothetical protein AAGF88_12130 [Pseudomonadota bacterium]
MNQRLLPAARVVSKPQIAPPSDLTELMLAGRRQFWCLALGALMGLGLGVLHYATSPREYRATATVLIEERQSDLEQEIAATLPTARSDTSVMNQVQILGSLHLAAEVARALELTHNDTFQNPPNSLLGETIGAAKGWVRSLIPRPAPPPLIEGASGTDEAILQTADRLRARTDFTRIGRSFVVEISHSASDPVLATDIVNAYAEAYLADGIEASVAASVRTADWMEARIEELRRSAVDAAAEAEAFRAEFGASDQQGLRERQERADALNELLVTFQSRYQEIAFESSFPSSSGRILSRALQPRDPDSPRAWQDLGAGLVLGLMLGLAIAVLREARETGLRTSGDVTRYLGLSFLGYLPVVSKGQLRRARSVEDASVAPGPRVAFSPELRDQGPVNLPPLLSRHSAQPLSARPVSGALIAPRDLVLSAYLPGSPADHALRRLHSAMDQGSAGQTGRILAIGGTEAGDGATQLAANLAHVSARAGKATLLIDGDFVHSGLTRALRASDTQGLVDVLDCVLPVGHAIRRIAGTGLDILPTGLGARRGDVMEASYLAEFGALLIELAGVYDTIVVDLPPLAQYPEVTALIRQVDQIVLCVPWGRRSRRAIADFLASAPDLTARIAGLVLTNTRLNHLPRYGEQRQAMRRSWRILGA